MTAPQAANTLSVPSDATSRRSRHTRQMPPEHEALIASLEEAGATLLSLPRTGYSPTLKTTALPILREAAEAYGWSSAEIRPAMPSASQISRMDTVFAYLSLIPQERYLMRRIIGCRALVHPISGRHLFSWRRLAELLRADHKAIQRWHGEGIRIIIVALRRLAAEEKAAQAEQMRRMAGLPLMARPGSVARLTGFDGPGTSTGLLEENAPS